MFTGREPVPAGAAGEQGGRHGAHGGAVLTARQSEAADTTGRAGCWMSSTMFHTLARVDEDSHFVLCQSSAWPAHIKSIPHCLERIQSKSGLQKISTCLDNIMFRPGNYRN